MQPIRAALAAIVLTATAGVGTVLGTAPSEARVPDPVPGSAGAAWPDKTVDTVGKLVADFPGGSMESCSAAIVDAPNGSLVATAAHCLENPDRRRKPAAVYFTPGYDHGGGPATVVDKGWRTRTWQVAPGWDMNRPVDEILPYDWAFLRFPPRNGRTLQETYGANRLRFGPVDDGRTLTLGYPAVSPYDGESLKYCGGTARVYGKGEGGGPGGDGALSLKPCDLTQGVSGGPWLRGYDASRQSGTLVGVTSLGGKGELLGRPFPEAARKVVDRLGATG